MIEHRERMTPDGFAAILDANDRVALTGMTGSGKSLLLAGTRPEREVIHTDDLRGRFDFERISAAIVNRLRDVPRFLLAGMLAPHALRDGLRVDAVVWIERPRPGAPEGRSPNLWRMLDDYEREHPAVRVYLVERAMREEEV